MIGPVVERSSGANVPSPCGAGLRGGGRAAASANSKGKARRGNNILEKNRAAAILTR